MNAHPKHSRLILSALSAAVLAASTAAPAAASTFTYIGPDGGDWITPANWSSTPAGNPYPQASDSATIIPPSNFSDAFDVVYDANISLFANGTGGITRLTLDGTPTASVTLHQSANSNGIQNLNIGNSNTATYDQSGGTNGAKFITLYSYGAYQLSGGTLNSVDTLTNSGNFTQTAGNSTIAHFNNDAQSNVTFTGGVLNITTTFDSTGCITLGSGTLNATSAIVNLTHVASLTGGSNTTFTVDANSILILPTGFTPLSATGAGIVHYRGTTLDIPASANIVTAGTIDDLVTLEGKMNGNSVNLKGGVFLSGTAVLGGNGSVGFVNIYADNLNSGMSGGSINDLLEQIGTNAPGLFTQSAGSNTSSHLIINPLGTYEFDGGTLSPNTLTNSGNFTQTAGSTTVSDLKNTAGASLHMTGGTLVIKHGFDNFGSVDFGSGNSTITVSPNIVFNLGPGTVAGGSQTSFAFGTNCLFNLPAGVDPNTQFLSVTGSPLIHIAGTSFNVTTGQSYTFIGQLYDRVVATGTGSLFAVSSSSHLTLLGGINIADNAVVGNLTKPIFEVDIDDQTSGMSGGSLVAITVAVGNVGNGKFTQTGGSNNNVAFGGEAPILLLGYHAGSFGEFDLSNGTLQCEFTYVGDYGNGTFYQSGGTITGRDSFSDLIVGTNPGANGAFILTNGNLSISNESIGAQGFGFLSLYQNSTGPAGNGTFVQSGGSNTVSNKISIGPTSSYTLSAGSLTTPKLDNAGTLTISGGVPNITNLSNTGTLSLSNGIALQVASFTDALGAHTALGITSLASFSKIIVTGNTTTTLLSDLHLTFDPTYTPALGDAFTILTTTGPLAGKFSAVSTSGLGPHFGAYVTYSTHNATAVIDYLGDANLDNQVTIADLNAVAANWQQNVSDWTQGDFNGDGLVTIADLNAIAANWQAGVGAGSNDQSFSEALASIGTFNPTSVPEPASLALLLTFLPPLLTRRINRHKR